MKQTVVAFGKRSKVEYFRAREIANFKKLFIEKNRGQMLNFIRCQDLQGCTNEELTQKLLEGILELLGDARDLGSFYVYFAKDFLYIGLVSLPKAEIANIDEIIGRIHKIIETNSVIRFHFGISRTPCNFISESDEIFNNLVDVSLKNLEENIRRWGWTKLNNIQRYFSNVDMAAVIQPFLQYIPSKKVFSLVGGEVFVGGNIYGGYHKLFADVPNHQDRNRIELLIVEKLILECSGAPGLLKFNISPQTLIDTFDSREKVRRFHDLLLRAKLNPEKVRIELIEQPYQETHLTLKEICESFWKFGISFAADDFGVKSQSHQVILELGELIKEFKLDPMSFKFKQNEDHTKFLDNLAFIDYCKRLADNREAVITAEAVIDYDSLRFLIAHNIYCFQTNLFCGKISLDEYKEIFYGQNQISEEVVHTILTSPRLLAKLRKSNNLFKLVDELKLA